jgi:hypothetical protein
MQSYARGDVVGPHLQRGMVVRSYLDASKGARGLTTWHTINMNISEWIERSIIDKTDDQ